MRGQLLWGFAVSFDADVPVALRGPSVDEATQRCLNLWAAVFRLSALDAAREMRANKPGPALRWFHSESNKAGGFLWCCDILHLNANSVRSALYAKRRELYQRSKGVPQDD